MLIVGLTGGIASGKSTVSNVLQTVHSIPLIDLDILARQAVAPNSYALASIVSHFGPAILHVETGELNREKLGEIIFGNEKERKVLNRIVHPAVRRLLAWELIKHWLRGEKMVVVDAPLLIEAGLWKFCAVIVVVYCSEPLQLQRLLARNTFLTPALAQARLTAQQPLSSKLAYADYIIDNSGPLTSLTSQLDRVLVKLDERAGGWTGWGLSWVIPPLGLVRGCWRVFWRLYVKQVGGKKVSTKGGSRGEGQRGSKRGTRGERSRHSLLANQQGQGEVDDDEEIEMRVG